MKMLEIEVCEVRGYCPVYRVGDKIVINNLKIVLEKTDALCVHALSSLLHYVLVLERGANPVELRLAKPEDENTRISNASIPVNRIRMVGQ